MSRFMQFVLTPFLVARYCFWLTLALIAGTICGILTVALIMVIRFKSRR